MFMSRENASLWWEAVVVSYLPTKPREVRQDSLLSERDSIRILRNTIIAKFWTAEWLSSHGTEKGNNNLVLTRRPTGVPQILCSAVVIEDSGPAARRCGRVEEAQDCEKHVYRYNNSPKNKACKFERV
jgi:hypothetical protein